MNSEKLDNFFKTNNTFLDIIEDNFDVRISQKNKAVHAKILGLKFSKIPFMAERVVILTSKKNDEVKISDSINQNLFCLFAESKFDKKVKIEDFFGIKTIGLDKIAGLFSAMESPIPSYSEAELYKSKIIAEIDKYITKDGDFVCLMTKSRRGMKINTQSHEEEYWMALDNTFSIHVFDIKTNQMVLSNKFYVKDDVIYEIFSSHISNYGWLTRAIPSQLLDPEYICTEHVGITVFNNYMTTRAWAKKDLTNLIHNVKILRPKLKYISAKVVIDSSEVKEIK